MTVMAGISTAKRRERARIEAEVAEFLARGGEIRKFGPDNRENDRFDWRDIDLNGKRRKRRAPR